MKPKAIVRFEWFFLAGSALWAAATLLYHAPLRDFAIARGGPPIAPLIALAIGSAVIWFIWFFIARRGSNIVRWVLCVFQIFALLALPAIWAKHVQLGLGYAILILLSKILQTAALLLLCGNDVRLWFLHKGRMPEAHSDVFG